MKDISLNKAASIVIDAIVDSDIEEIDKVELMLNLYQFLNHYDEMIKNGFNKGGVKDVMDDRVLIR